MSKGDQADGNGGPVVLAPPRGFRDILPTEARELRAIERTLSEVFASYGYLPLDPPLVEHGDATPVAGPARLISFLDRDGTRVALRPDITSAVARLVAQRYSGPSGALRLSYFAPVFREEPAMLGAERQYDQAGAELVGAVGPLADAEVLALMAESLACAGLHDQQIEVGHVGVLMSLFAELDDASRAVVLRELRDGDHVGAFKRARRAGMSTDGLRRAERGLAARGMSELDALTLPEASALHEVIALARQLFGGTRGDWAVPNLALLPTLPYYTGIVFEALRPDVGFAIASGGRYDGLLSAYGAARPAAGFAINVPRLHRALFATGWRPRHDQCLVVIEPGDPRRTARLASALRGVGVTAAIGPIAESGGLAVVNVDVVDDEHVRHADGRVLTVDELARVVA